MTLIAILLALAAGRILRGSQHLRTWQWVGDYVDALLDRLGERARWDGAWGVLISLAPPLLAVALAQHLVHRTGLGWLNLAFGTPLLWYSLGPRDPEGEIEDFLAARHSGEQGRALQIADDFAPAGPDRPQQEDVDLRMTEAVLVEANERLFAPLLWFALLGAFGAVAFRLTVALCESERAQDLATARFGDAARALHELLAWVPARLLAMTYALAGSFEDALRAWRHSGAAGSLAESNAGLLLAAGLAALRLESTVLRGEPDESTGTSTVAVRAAGDLVWRSLLIWISVVALPTVGGWAA